MTKLAAPLILAAHADKLPTLDGWDGVAVFEGAALTREDLRAYVTLGHVAASDEPTVSAEFVHTQGQNREAGTIASQLLVAAADVAAARTRAFELVGAWSAWLAGDATLDGVLLPGSSLRLSVDVALATTRAGATANTLVTVTYNATTYG